jgi:Flp pilus assembly protein CpaB
VTLRDSGPAVSLFPGALVDVLATVEAQGTGSSQREVVTRTVLERGRVLAVNEEALGARPSQSAVANAIDRRGSATSRKMTVTLAVTPEQASAVEFASARGTIGITVRADDDTTTPAAAPAPPSVATEKPAAEKPAVAAAAAPESDTGKWQTWDVLVIRGKDTERHSFANSPKPKAP